MGMVNIDNGAIKHNPFNHNKQYLTTFNHGLPKF